MKARKVGYIKPMQGSARKPSKANPATVYNPTYKNNNNISMQAKKNKKFYSARGKTRP